VEYALGESLHRDNGEKKKFRQLAFKVHGGGEEARGMMHEVFSIKKGGEGTRPPKHKKREGKGTLLELTRGKRHNVTKKEKSWAHRRKINS